MTGNVATLAANGSSSWLRLGRGLNTIYVSCTDWSTTTVSLSVALDKDGTGAEPVYLRGEAYVASGSTERQITLWGDGESCVRMTTANYANPLTLTVRSSMVANRASGV